MIPFKYTITKEIHASEGATVYAGHRIDDRSPVALKIPSGECPSPKQVARLKHEHAILQDLPLPGVLRAHGIETWEQGIALVLEGFDGQPLRDLARARRMSPREIVDIGAQVADALGAIHGRGVIHKDVKPHNILVGSAPGQVKLTDFSVAARLSATEPHAPNPKVLEGTLAYMPPEQTGRLDRPLDQRSDLYALGVTLYEVLTSVLPFQSTDPLELIHSHIARTPAPPHQFSPGIPRVVSDIVMKLLAKPAEDRYQTAHGLKADLEECLKRWDEDGHVAAFPLGQHDRNGRIGVPRKLYARERETAAILAALERAAGGAAELLLVPGPSGIGKSALVNEVQRTIARRRGGLFAAGRFDELSRRVPYAPVMQPFRELCRQILTERAEALESWKGRILGALGPNGQALADLVPELSFIVGSQPAQPAAPELGPAESWNRLRLVFQDLVRALGAREHPLVLFLDDLQWADATSLELVKTLFADPRRAHLLLIGAYRDDEMDAQHPLLPAIDEVRRAGVAVSTLELSALSAPEVAELIADAMGCAPERAAPLAAIVGEKTGGNPLFLGQFLRDLRARGLVAFDAGRGEFAWDLRAIREAPLTDNVASFLERKLAALSPAAQRALEIAACIGHTFDLAMLSAVAERSAPDAAALIQEAMNEGLVVPEGAPAAPLRGGDQASEGASTFRFLHERVQQSAYAYLPEEQKQAIHLRLGRLLQGGSQGLRSNEALFSIATHLSLGAPLMADPRECLELAAMNLEAGRRAKGRAAYPAALRYFEGGISALPDGTWAENHALAFALHAEGAECAYLGGEFARAESLLDVLLSRARTAVEGARAHEMRITQYITQGRVHDALRVGRAALALLDIDLPELEAARKVAADAELTAARNALGRLRIKDLLRAREMADQNTRAALKLLVSLTLPASLASPALATFVTAKQVNLSLEQGHSDLSAYGYMAYGGIAARLFRRYGEAYELGTLALELNDRFQSPDLSCKLHFMFGAHISFFTKHLLSSLDQFAQAHEAGLRTGDLTYLSTTCVQTAVLRFGLGDECTAVCEEVDRSLALMQRTRDELCTLALMGVRRALDSLMASPAPFDEAAYESKIAGPASSAVALIYYALRQQLCFLHEDYAGALRMGSLGEAKNDEGGVGHYIVTELYFYTCLTLLSPSLSRGRQPAAISLSSYKDRMAEWAERCPDNYRHKHLLIRAEAARVAGEELAAMKLYDQAIESAKVNGIVRDEALAGELCAKFHLASGREKIAHLYMTDAYHGYLRWGATAKMDQLAKKYPHLLAQAALGVHQVRSEAPGASVDRPELLDTMTVIRAARAISGEIVLHRLLDRLLRIVLESAGAQRGLLLLSRDGPLTVEAEITVDPDSVRVGPPIPIEAAADLAATVVQYVARTQEPVVLGDARSAERFAEDPYVVAAGARSIMCLAMAHQGRLIGVLYLENNAAAGAFSAAQIELCTLLASQAGIAVQNALLYGRVQETSSELKRGKDALEAEVARRTEQLREANDQLKLELTSRQRTEQERAALQEEIIRVQHDRLLELSAPLIPITDRIMVMPLVGEMDSARAAQVLETTLRGAAASRAEVVIIDVTGTKRVEAGVANALLQAAGALRLLGARVVITGIRPEAARTLVELGVDLSGLVTRGTLQSGLAYALERIGGDARWLERRRAV